MDDTERERIAAEHRERERNETVECEHCGTKGIYTYSGVIGPWSKDDGKQLSEFSEELDWDGTHYLGRDHNLARCFAKVKAERDQLREEAASLKTYHKTEFAALVRIAEAAKKVFQARERDKDRDFGDLSGTYNQDAEEDLLKALKDGGYAP